MLYRSMLFALITTLALASNALGAEQETDSHKIVGLVRVLKKKREHWYSLRAPRVYEYKLANTTKTLILTKPLKRIPDLRTFGEKHDLLQKFHDGANWGYPILAIGLLAVSAIRGR